MKSGLEALVAKAKTGDKDALEQIVGRIQDRVYTLSLRMLYHPEDAEDAAQEILIKVITHLSAFQEKSAFTTWVYRIAANHLLTMRKSRMEQHHLTLDQVADQIDLASAQGWIEEASEAQQGLIVEEIRLRCLQGMLQCLDRKHRLVFVLADVFEASGQQGAYILRITEETFRKRLSRSRARMRDFMQRQCGLMNPANRCSCSRQAAYAIKTGRLDPNEPIFARCSSPPFFNRTDSSLARAADELDRLAALFKDFPSRSIPETIGKNLRRIIDSGRYVLLREKATGTYH